MKIRKKERLEGNEGSKYGTGIGVTDVSRFAYKSFRLQVDSPTSRSFRLHDQVVSPTRSESIRLHQSRFAYTYKSKCFVKMDEHHCLQLAEESYLTVFPVKFLYIIYSNYVHRHKYVLERS